MNHVANSQTVSEVPRLVTLQEVMKQFRACRRTIEREIERGRLEAVKIGGKVCFTPDALAAYLRRRVMKPVDAGQ